jgi:ubiquinone/menaquinone biosynthesis C-methylase UbiE
MYRFLSLTALAAAMVYFVWRLASRRQSLPCPVWLRGMVEMDNPLANEHRAAAIIEHLALQPGMAALDAGCGPGRVTLPLAEAVGPQGRVVALDMQPGMLDVAAEKARVAGLSNIEFVNAGLGEGKLAAQQFDRAVLVTVLGEIPDRAAALREIFAALKPGGILSVTELVFDPHFQPRSKVVQLATAAGFREQAAFGPRFAYTVHLVKPLVQW